MDKLRVFSFGQGQQSQAVLILDILGRIEPFDYYIFANVGEEAEHPDTLAYFREITLPLAEKHGKRMLEVKKVGRKGKVYDLYTETVGENKTIPIPAYMQNNAPMLRNCTSQYKIKPVDKRITELCKELDVEYVELGIGFDANEGRRVNKKPTGYNNHTLSKSGNITNKTSFYKRYVFPLYDLGFTREDCNKVIVEFGLTPPRTSCCYFCPFQNDVSWFELRSERPDLFEKAVMLENRLNQKREKYGKDAVSLHKQINKTNLPLEQVVPKSNEELLEVVLFGDNCDSGYCGL